ncbi:vesicular inhibitory amino acid transporter [Nematostella vectensis]|uniref:vesicular inhibitory amino acid transporter n=1 Tax=Nematostella vectensis TaxID=45351 RepID=UPI0020776A3E|nr:vesicular inhibitory amino acid transporter [Nematostella vectensis]
MENVKGLISKYIPVFISSKKDSSDQEYIHVKREEEVDDDDYEFGGKTCAVEAGDEDNGEEKEKEKTLDETSGTKGISSDVPQKSTTSLQAAWNISNLIQGTGTLGIPYAVSKGGYMALVAIVFIAVITNYTGKLIIECLYERPMNADGKRGRRLRKSYAALGQSCWKRKGALLVCAAQVMQLTCACVLYLMLVTDFFYDLFEHKGLSRTAWSILAGVVLLPSIFLNQLNRISWLSMFSVFALVMVFLTVIGYGVSQRYSWDAHMPFTTPQGLPVAWGIILFSFVCHPYLPGIEENMTSPESFDQVMNYSFIISAATKLIYGFIAVLTFKQDTKQEISENLPAGALENTANGFLGLNGLFSYALPTFTLFTVLNKARLPCLPRCFPDEKTPFTKQERGVVYLLRAVFVVLTVAIAVFVPEFSLLMAIIGSISGVFLTLVFPPLFYIILHLEHISSKQYVVNILIVCVGVLSGGFGLVFSVIALMKVYLTGED